MEEDKVGNSNQSQCCVSARLMALVHPCIFMCHLLFFMLLFFSCCSYNVCAHESKKADGSYYVIDKGDLLPKTNCSASTKDPAQHSQGLQVSHRYGPCSPLGKRKKSPSPHQTFLDDESRVSAINANTLDQYSKDKPKAKRRPDSIQPSDNNYVVTVGFGTPPHKFTMIFDTGSDTTWIQCKPCSKRCYSQKEPIFDPSMSSSYTNHSCILYSDKEYSIPYLDGSYSHGIFGCDTLTLSPSEVFHKFQFGCGQNNSDGFDTAAGVLGLGQGDLSAVSQIASKTFSYCLPKRSSEGYLRFGQQAIASSSRSLQFTPLQKHSDRPSLYFLKLVGISVANKKLNISPSIWASPGTVIDSGTVITRLPLLAYSALRSAFRKSMSNYPFSDRPFPKLLDTCYDLRRFSRPRIPKIALHFEGGTDMNLDPSGIIWTESESQFCLAFAPNNDTNDLTIIGSTQQQTLQVFYDLKGGRVGFGIGGCSN